MSFSAEAPSSNRSAAVCLTVAGSDSGGGAGIQADLRAFADMGVFGLSAVTAVTAQNPFTVSAVHALSAAAVTAQLGALREAFTVAAVKTGMLADAALIDAVADALAAFDAPPPLVVDPVMVAASGAPLIEDAAVARLAARLLPGAGLVTPNRAEAERLLGRRLCSETEALAGAHELSDRFAAPVLLKGGHAPGDEAVDLLVAEGAAYRLAAPRLDPPTTHGTGCALSAAIAAGLARRRPLLEAVRDAKAYVHRTLAGCRQVGPRAYARWPEGPDPTITVTRL